MHTFLQGYQELLERLKVSGQLINTADITSVSNKTSYSLSGHKKVSLHSGPHASHIGRPLSANSTQSTSRAFNNTSSNANTNANSNYPSTAIRDSNVDEMNENAAGNMRAELGLGIGVGVEVDSEKFQQNVDSISRPKTSKGSSTRNVEVNNINFDDSFAKATNNERQGEGRGATASDLKVIN
jgi:hypothetical protein